MRALFIVTALVALSACDSSAPTPAVPPNVGCGGAEYPDWQTSDYVLPYPVGESYVVLQGNCGVFSHQTTMERYGYDFTMPIGEPVVAVRAGRVHKTEARYADTDHDTDHANGVIVDHGDGVYSRYLHFTQGGVAVAVDDRVEAGDTLGYSGNSGFSTQPHLHIDVLTDCVDGDCRSLPVTFRNTAPNPLGLVQGRSYTALP